jgi:hypothetical protein
VRIRFALRLRFVRSSLYSGQRAGAGLPPRVKIRTFSATFPGPGGCHLAQDSQRSMNVMDSSNVFYVCAAWLRRLYGTPVSRFADGTTPTSHAMKIADPRKRAGTAKRQTIDPEEEIGFLSMVTVPEIVRGP